MSFSFPKSHERPRAAIQLPGAEIVGHSIDPVSGKENWKAFLDISVNPL
jgi:hypothetical protein